MRLSWFSTAAAVTTTTLSRSVFAFCRCHSHSHSHTSRRTFVSNSFWKNNVCSGKLYKSAHPSTSALRARQTRTHTTTVTMLPLPLVDVDCNLWHQDLASLQNKDNDSLSLSDKIQEFLQEDAIQEANIVAMLSPSSTIVEAERGLDALHHNNFRIPIYTTVGVHPYHVNDDELANGDDCGGPTETHIATMKALLVKYNSKHSNSNHNLACAVGECGLDASDGFPSLQDQLPWFQAQVQLAAELQVPLFLHERLAFEETMNVLQQAGYGQGEITVPVLVHCFTGTREECRQYISKGFSLSVSGFICKDTEGSAEVRACLEEGLIPLDKLMVETDAPYMGFNDCRSLYVEKNESYVASLNSKKRKRLVNSMYPNLPSSLPKVAAKVLESLNTGRIKRGEPLLEHKELVNQMTENSIRFFNFSVE